MSELVKLEKNGQIITIMLANPPVNAVSTKVLNALNAAFDERRGRRRRARASSSPARASSAFCAGGDLREEKDFGDPETARAFRTLGPQHAQPHRERQAAGDRRDPRLLHRRRHRAGLGLRHPRRGRELGVPRGRCLSRRAAELGHGPHAAARAMSDATRRSTSCCSARTSAPKEAYDMGLVTKVVPRAKLMDEAQAMAQRICQRLADRDPRHPPGHGAQPARKLGRHGALRERAVRHDVLASRRPRRPEGFCGEARAPLRPIVETKAWRFEACSTRARSPSSAPPTRSAPASTPGTRSSTSATPAASTSSIRTSRSCWARNPIPRCEISTARSTPSSSR